VEDERAQREALARYLGRAGYEVEAVASGEAAIERLPLFAPAVLLTDLRLTGVDGLEVVRRSRELDEEMGVLLVTAWASVDSAVEALRLGAHDYLLKPLIFEEVGRKVAGLLEHRELVRENARLRRLLQEREPASEVVAESPAMREAIEWARRAAGSRSTVLLTGESGTGKEVLARAIHAMGPWSEEPFLAVNVSAVPEALAESELFGHERGAFTGAERRREGILRAAGGGTVFLDEIGELPPTVQAKLLRALETREVQPLGSDRPLRFEARILAGTNRDLTGLVDEGRFREDLYYRLNVVRIQVPPLRERPEDVPPLVRHLLRRHAVAAGVPVPAVTPEAMRALCQNPWRGNVRELSNVVERALILSPGSTLQLDEAFGGGTPAGPGVAGGGQTIEAVERAHVEAVLERCGGRVEGPGNAAAVLGLKPSTLRSRMKKLGIRRA